MLHAPTHLMICNQDKSARELAYQIPICSLTELASHSLVSTNSDNGWGPALGHGGDKETPRLFCKRHPSIIPIFID